MIDPAYVLAMARYNIWQNGNLFTAAETLSPDDRAADRGAFFGSIHGTLNHLLWGDQMWMSRFTDRPKPEIGIGDSGRLFANWDDLARNRRALDSEILAWAEGLDGAWLAGELSWYSGATKREMTHQLADLVVHFFNHQTHHRGQVHAMLTAAGAHPDDTDLMLMPVE